MPRMTLAACVERSCSALETQQEPPKHVNPVKTLALYHLLWCVSGQSKRQ